MPGSRLRFAAALTACFTYCVLVGEVFTFVPLLAEARGLRVELVGLLVGIFWLGRTATSLPAGMLADRAGAHVVLVPAFIVGCIGSAVAAGASTPLVMFVGVAMMGLCDEVYRLPLCVESAKTGQQGGMDIDNAVFKSLYQIFATDTHISCQTDQIGCV